ncbi:hypothetical protein ACLB2K_005947 [Fragaria x ananassa]
MERTTGELNVSLWDSNCRVRIGLSRSPSGLVSNFPIVALLALTVSIDRQVIQKSKLGNISSSGDTGALIRLVKKSGRAPFSFLIREVARPAHTNLHLFPLYPLLRTWAKTLVFVVVQITAPLCGRQSLRYSLIAQLKLGDLEGALLDTDFALRDWEDNVKAMFRQGQTYMALNDIDSAVESFKKALELEPNDGGIKKELQVAKKKVRELHMFLNLLSSQWLFTPNGRFEG